MNYITEYLSDLKVTASPQTYQSYEGRLNRFFEFSRQEGKKQEWWTKPFIRRFLNHLVEQKLEPSTIRTYQDTISALLSWMTHRDILDKNPMHGSRVVKVVKKSKRVGFTEDEYRNIKTAAAVIRLREHWFWRDAIVIAWNTGLRLADVAQLEWTEINLVTKAVKLEPQKTGRYGTIVEIPMADELFTMLAARVVEPAHEKWVLPDMARQYQECPELLSVQFGRLCKKAHVEGKSFHCFRHAFITRMLSHGIPAPIVSSMTGQTLKIIMGYFHPSLEDKRKHMEGVL